MTLYLRPTVELEQETIFIVVVLHRFGRSFGERIHNGGHDCFVQPPTGPLRDVFGDADPVV